MQWETISFVSAAIATILLLHSGQMVSQAATHELKEKLVDVQAERLRNAAIALSQAPKASNEIEMPGYEFKFDFAANEINVTYDDESATVSFNPEEMNYCEVEAPTEITRTNGSVCLKRLPTDPSECSSSGIDLGPLTDILDWFGIGSSLFQAGGEVQGAKLNMSAGGC